MKSITVYFEDQEFEKLKEKKGNISWHDFIFQLAENEKIKEKNNGKKTY